MTAAKAIEYRITRQLMQRREGGQGTGSRPAETLIAVLAATAAVFVLGAYLQELLWVLLAAGTAITLGIR